MHTVVNIDCIWELDRAGIASPIENGLLLTLTKNEADLVAIFSRHRRFPCWSQLTVISPSRSGSRFYCSHCQAETAFCLINSCDFFFLPSVYLVQMFLWCDVVFSGPDEQARNRFQAELEFVQCLANPYYLNCKSMDLWFLFSKVKPETGFLHQEGGGCLMEACNHSIYPNPTIPWKPVVLSEKNENGIENIIFHIIYYNIDVVKHVYCEAWAASPAQVCVCI